MYCRLEGPKIIIAFVLLEGRAVTINLQGLKQRDFGQLLRHHVSSVERTVRFNTPCMKHRIIVVSP